MTRLEKLGMELKKLYSRKDKLEERISLLEEKYREEENTQIQNIVHGANLTPQQLARLIQYASVNTPKKDLLGILGEEEHDEKMEK